MKKLVRDNVTTWCRKGVVDVDDERYRVESWSEGEMVDVEDKVNEDGVDEVRRWDDEVEKDKIKKGEWECKRMVSDDATMRIM
jgi:hypothetical protein